MIRLLIGLLLLGLLGVAWGEEKQRPLSQAEALAIAFEKNPDLKAAEGRLQAAFGMEKQERAEAGFQLMAHGLFQSTTSMTMIPNVAGYDPMAWFMSPRGTQSGGTAVATFPIFTGGKVSGAARGATRSREGESLRYEEAKVQLAYAVRVGYTRVLVAEGGVRVASDALSEHLEALRRVEKLVEAGKVPAVYLYRARAETSEARRKLVEAENDLELRRVELLRILGLPLQTRIELTDRLEESESFKLPELNALLEEAQNHRPGLQAQKKEVTSREAFLQSARGNYFPQVYFYGRADTLSGSPDQFNGTSFGVIASYPIFDGGKREGKVEEAEGKLKEARFQEEALALEVGREVTQAWLSLRAARAMLEEAREGVKSAREDLRIARLRFESGKGIQLEVLDAVTAYTRARVRELEALEALETALASLDRAVGKGHTSTSPNP